MSDTAQVSLPSVSDAQAALDNVYQEAFFAKMAELGHQPQTQEDAIGMLEAGYQLDLIPDKQAYSTVGQYSTANTLLKHAFADNGINTGLATPDPQQLGIKQAAYALASDPGYYASVLALRAAE